MSPLLDLSGADTSGFEPLPSGSYHAEVFSAEMGETKGGPEAKLPKGTPRMNVQFKITGKVGEDKQGEDSPYHNRRQFNGYTFPPAKDAEGKKYDEGKASKMKGMIVRFFTAIGFNEEDVVKPDFDPDFGDLAGRPCIISVKQKPKFNGAEGELDNEVTGVRPAGAVVAGSGSKLM